jgi:hypothetical protein
MLHHPERPSNSSSHGFEEVMQDLLKCCRRSKAEDFQSCFDPMRTYDSHMNASANESYTATDMLQLFYQAAIRTINSCLPNLLSRELFYTAAARPHLELLAQAFDASPGGLLAGISWSALIAMLE